MMDGTGCNRTEEGGRGLLEGPHNTTVHHPVVHDVVPVHPEIFQPFREALQQGVSNSVYWLAFVCLQASRALLHESVK